MLSDLLMRLRALFRRNAVENDLNDEVRFHFDQQVEKLIQAGVPLTEARRRAAVAFGGTEQVKDECRDARGTRFLETLVQDVRYGARLLKHNPGMTATVGLTLALIIGANAAVFSVVKAVLLQDLPFPKPEQLVLLWGTSEVFGPRSQISFTDMSDWRRDADSLDEVAAFQSWWNPTLNLDDRPEHVGGLQVSDGYFRVMQTPPLLGRVFLPEEQNEGSNRVVILTYGLWQERFQADPQIVGKTIQLDGVPHTVVGVMPAGFHSLPPSLLNRTPRLYAPLAEAYDDSRRGWTHLRAIARLKPGVSVEKAQAELSVIAERSSQVHPASNAGRSVRVVPLKIDVVRSVRPALLVLEGAILVVLLIACANLANLSLARSAARQKEIILRAALGASRRRLLFQLLTESMLLAAVGGAFGLLIARWGVSLLHNLGAHMLLDFPEISLDWSVLAVSAGIVILTGLIFGAAPAFSLSRMSPDGCLKSDGRSAGNANRSKLRRLLIVAEVSMSAVLLVCAGLLLRSFVSLLGVNPGFDAHNVFTAEISLPDAKYSRRSDKVAFYTRLMGSLQTLPGVGSASAVSILPESGKADHTDVRIAGRSDPPGQELTPDVYRITPDYFRTLRIPLLDGRAFTEQDDGSHSPVTIVNQTLARTLWPNQTAIGQKIWTGAGQTWRTVVGVADDVYQYGRDSAKTMQFYVPHAENGAGSMTVLVRSSRSSDDISRAIRSTVRLADPEQAVFDEATMESVVSSTVAARRFTLFIVLAFATAALLLAGIGLYGVVAYGAAQRTREFGIRVALGASRGDVLRLVLGEGAQLVVLGLVAGLIAALAVTRLVSTLLFGVSPNDALTFCGVSVVLLIVALAASYLPASRAMRVDPAIALREE